MGEPFVDTDILIRLLTGDDPQKQAGAVAMFQEVESGNFALSAPDMVIADAVFVLSSPRLYNLPHAEISALLSTLVRLRDFKVQNRRPVLRALDLCASINIDFGDALIISTMERDGSKGVYSYDADFDGFSRIARRTP